MAYTRLNLSDGDVFNASHVSHIEDGIVSNESDITALNQSLTAIYNGDGGVYGFNLNSGDLKSYIDSNCNTRGLYYGAAINCENTPNSSLTFMVLVLVYATTYKTVLAFTAGTSAVIYELKFSAGTWRDWYSISPTIISTTNTTSEDEVTATNISLNASTITENSED